MKDNLLKKFYDRLSESQQVRLHSGLLNWNDQQTDDYTKTIGKEENKFFEPKNTGVNLFVGSKKSKDLLQNIMEYKGHKKAVVSSGKRSVAGVMSSLEQRMDTYKFNDLAPAEQEVVREVLLRAPDKDSEFTYPRGTKWKSKAKKALENTGMEQSKVTDTLNSLIKARGNYAGFQSKHRSKNPEVRGMAVDLGFDSHFGDVVTDTEMLNGKPVQRYDSQGAKDLAAMLDRFGIKTIYERDAGTLHIDFPTEEDAFIAQQEFERYKKGSDEERQYIMDFFGKEKTAKYAEDGTLEDRIIKGVRLNREKYGSREAVIERLNAIQAFKNN